MAIVDEVAQRRTGEARTDDAVAALLQGLTLAVAPPLGVPVEAQSPHRAKFGQMVVIDGGSAVVHLPKIERSRLGDPRAVVTVVSTTSTTSITVHCSETDTVRGAATDTLTDNYAIAAYFPYRVNQWARALLT